MMRRFPTASITLALSAVAIFLSGCPDPQGVADDFVQNRAELDLRDMSGGEDPPTDGGMEESDAEVMACRAPADVTGTYMMAVLTALDPGKPLLLKVDVVSDVESDPPTVKMTLQPLGVEDKTPLGEIIEPDPVEVDGDGRFSIPFGNVVVTGGANPISGSEIEADLTLLGEIRGEQDLCGTIEGDLIRPTAFSLNGSTVGMLLVEDGNFADVTPKVECESCPGE